MDGGGNEMSLRAVALLAGGIGVAGVVLAALTPVVVHGAAAWPWWLRVPAVAAYLAAWGAMALAAGAAAAEWHLRRRAGSRPEGSDRA